MLTPDDEKAKQMKKYKEELVKFTKTEYISTILSNKLKASFPHEFNDPFDSRFHITPDDVKLISQEINFPMEKILFYIEFLQSSQITSLIEINPIDYKSNLMWAHYANCGKEMAVIYDKKLVLNMHKQNFHKVNYTNDPTGTKEIIKSYAVAHIEDDNKKKSEVVNHFFKQKIKHWEYENEFRIISLGYFMTLSGWFHQTFADNEALCLKMLQSKYLQTSTYHDLSRIYTRVSDPVVENLKLPFTTGVNAIDPAAVTYIPHYDTLFVNMPKPEKIVLGWNVDAFREAKILADCQKHNILLSKLKIPSGVVSESGCYMEVILNSIS